MGYARFPGRFDEVNEDDADNFWYNIYTKPSKTLSIRFSVIVKG